MNHFPDILTQAEIDREIRLEKRRTFFRAGTMALIAVVTALWIGTAFVPVNAVVPAPSCMSEGC